MACTNICIARPKKGLPKCGTEETSAKETTSSVVVNNDGASEGFDMEVEVIEHMPGESSPSAKGSMPTCVLSPSASVPSPKGKGKAKDTHDELEDVEEENVRLREENAHLRTSILGMRMPSRLTCWPCPTNSSTCPRSGLTLRSMPMLHSTDFTMSSCSLLLALCCDIISW
jgi:hypothetical protein